MGVVYKAAGAVPTTRTKRQTGRDGQRPECLEMKKSIGSNGAYGRRSVRTRMNRCCARSDSRLRPLSGMGQLSGRKMQSDANGFSATGDNSSMYKSIAIKNRTAEQRKTRPQKMQMEMGKMTVTASLDVCLIDEAALVSFENRAKAEPPSAVTVPLPFGDS